MRSGEDVDLCWRLIEAGARLRYEPIALVGTITEPKCGIGCAQSVLRWLGGPVVGATPGQDRATGDFRLDPAGVDADGHRFELRLSGVAVGRRADGPSDREGTAGC